jgi:hypothetical protein
VDIQARVRFIQRVDLAIDHRFVGHIRESFDDGWVTSIEVFVVSRTEVDFKSAIQEGFSDRRQSGVGG